jgi:hypothetical protein
VGVLNPNETERYRMQDISKNRWFTQMNPLMIDGKCIPSKVAEKLRFHLEQAGEKVVSESPYFCVH